MLIRVAKSFRIFYSLIIYFRLFLVKKRSTSYNKPNRVKAFLVLSNIFKNLQKESQILVRLCVWKKLGFWKLKFEKAWQRFNISC
jgi:hypothetical protein